MKILGYTLVWNQKCFIDGGCGADCKAYTSGGGDFVLFDRLGDPWPIHECYLNRHGTPGNAGFHSEDLHGTPVPGDPKRTWNPAQIVEIPATENGPKVAVTADVFELVRGAVTKQAAFKELAPAARDTLLKQLAGRTALATLDTGDGRRFVALMDAERIRKGDSILAELKPVKLTTGVMFKVTQVKMIWRDGAQVAPA